MLDAMALSPLVCLLTAENASCRPTGLSFISGEKQLLDCLMKGYDPAVRPANDYSTPVTVTLSNHLLTIIDLACDVIITVILFRLFCNLSLLNGIFT